jgi:hypothetical protein
MGFPLSASTLEPFIKEAMTKCYSSLGIPEPKLNINKWIYRFIKEKKIRRTISKRTISLPDDWEKQVKEMIFRISWLISRYLIPNELILNCDETHVYYIASEKNVLAMPGQTPGDLSKDDKRGVTVVATITASCNVLQPQIIWEGKTPKCHPPQVFSNLSIAFFTPTPFV